MNNQQIGIAGELRVMSELILKGYNPAKSYIDDGIDIILQDGIKIQVKTSIRKAKENSKTLGYRFQVRKGNLKKVVDPSTYVDFLICWGVADNIFWIIPAKNIGKRSCIHITYPKIYKKTIWEKYQDRWNFLSGRGGE